MCSRGLGPIASRCGWCRGGRARRSRGCDGASIVRHVRLHEMSCAERAVERKLARQDTGGDDAGQLARVVARCLLVSAAHTEEVEHSGLWLENCAATDCADFDRGHGDRDLEVAIDTGKSQSTFDI